MPTNAHQDNFNSIITSSFWSWWLSSHRNLSCCLECYWYGARLAGVHTLFTTLHRLMRWLLPCTYTTQHCLWLWHVPGAMMKHVRLCVLMQVLTLKWSLIMFIKWLSISASFKNWISPITPFCHPHPPNAATPHPPNTVPLRMSS